MAEGASPVGVDPVARDPGERRSTSSPRSRSGRRRFGEHTFERLNALGLAGEAPLLPLRAFTCGDGNALRGLHTPRAEKAGETKAASSTDRAEYGWKPE